MELQKYPITLDEIDQWLFDNFGILPGACSSTENLRYNTARRIAEALWPKYQMELDGIVTLTESDFDAEKEKASEWGYNLCKEQMMNGAVDGEIGYWNQRGLSIRLDQSLEKLGYGEDTEVKVIIVKQDDRPRD